MNWKGSGDNIFNFFNLFVSFNRLNIENVFIKLSVLGLRDDVMFTISTWRLIELHQSKSYFFGRVTICEWFDEPCIYTCKRLMKSMWLFFVVWKQKIETSANVRVPNIFAAEGSDLPHESLFALHYGKAKVSLLCVLFVLFVFELTCVFMTR